MARLIYSLEGRVQAAVQHSRRFIEAILVPYTPNDSVRRQLFSAPLEVSLLLDVVSFTRSWSS